VGRSGLRRASRRGLRRRREFRGSKEFTIRVDLGKELEELVGSGSNAKIWESWWC